MRLPKVKNKYPAPVQVLGLSQDARIGQLCHLLVSSEVTVDDIVRSAEGPGNELRLRGLAKFSYAPVTGGTRNVGPRALPATTCRGIASAVGYLTEARD